VTCLFDHASVSGLIARVYNGSFARLLKAPCGSLLFIARINGFKPGVYVDNWQQATQTKGAPPVEAPL
jgi:hypothetical protein